MAGTAIIFGAAVYYPLRVVAAWPLAGGATILFESFIWLFLAGLGGATAYAGALLRNDNSPLAARIAGLAGLAVLVASGGVSQAFADVREHLALVMRADAAGRFIIWVLIAPWIAPLTAFNTARWAAWCHHCGRLLQLSRLRVLLFDWEHADALNAAVKRRSIVTCVERAKADLPANSPVISSWDGPVVRIRACRQCGAGSVIVVGQRPSTASEILINAGLLDIAEARALLAACDAVLAAKATPSAVPPVHWPLAVAFWGTLLAVIGGVLYFFRGAIVRFLEG